METQQHQTVIETLRDLQALSLKEGTKFFIQLLESPIPTTTTTPTSQKA